MKEWLTLSEAAAYLAASIGEEVQEKDILRLVLDKHLTLSVDLVNHSEGVRCDLVGLDGVEFVPSIGGDFTEMLIKLAKENGNYDPSHNYDQVMTSIALGDGLFLNKGENVESISGVWDLPLWGNEHLDILHKYQQLIGGPEVTLVCTEGTYVRKGNTVFELQADFDDNEYQKGSKAQAKMIEEKIFREKLPEEDAKQLRTKYDGWRKEYLEERSNAPYDRNYYPAGALPSDSVLIVRTEEILRFLTSIDENDLNEKPLGLREKNTLLVLISTLCKEANIDYEARGIASVIEKMTELEGVKISDDTIREILKQIPDAVESRKK